MPEQSVPTHIFRWDLDKTYLRTEFDTVRDLIKTALQTAEEKVNVPGAVELLRELKHEHADSLVTFISGSPSQMRKTLEQKFQLDGIEPDIFVLKPTLRYILSGQFGAVRGQVGFKLSTLLRLRAETPLAPETMFGDDAEQDAFIYSLYADIAADRVSRDTLREILIEADVHDEMRRNIQALAATLEPKDTARRILIHLEEKTPPGRFLVFGPRVVPIVNYFQAAVVLFADGTMGAQGVLRIAAAMMHRHGFGMLELTNSFEDLMRRRHLSPDVIDRFADGLEEGQAPADDDLTLPQTFIDQLIRRARSLAPRSRFEPRSWTGPPDYLEVLQSDRGLRESVQEKSSKGLFS
jgi:hypothetical protein